MSEAPRAPGAPQPSGSGRRRPPGEQSCYAALDLGTNNCRLLVATPSPRGFRVVEAYSADRAAGRGSFPDGTALRRSHDRSMAALKVCAEKIRRAQGGAGQGRGHQACRGATNGPDFVRRVAEETGLRLQIITPKEEAAARSAGCMSLFDRDGRGGPGGRCRRRLDRAVVGGPQGRRPRQQAPPVRGLRSCRSRPGCRSRSAWSPWPSAFPRASGRRRAGSGPWSTRSRRGSTNSRTRSRCAGLFRGRPGPHGRHLGRHHQPGRPAPGPAARWPTTVVDGLWMQPPRVRGGRRPPADPDRQGTGPGALHRGRPGRSGAGRSGAYCRPCRSSGRVLACVSPIGGLERVF